MQRSEMPLGSVGGIAFAITNLDEAIDWVIRHANADRVGRAVRLSNAYCVALAHGDSEYRELFTRGITFPDGLPVVKVLNSIGHSEARRVRGPSLFTGVLSRGQDADIAHFFLGGSQMTLDQLSQRVGEEFPRARIVGAYSPEFGPLRSEQILRWADIVNAADPDIVWVSLGTPKQDFAAEQLAGLTGRTVIAVGAAFDFLAGTVVEAPKWIQDSGLEWLFRLVSDPRRLWRRYLFGNLTFLRVAAITWLGGLRARDSE
jgi:N-acetylglucosaminyldiphosphoundecaprenol N-acetyl-beta-D-mannosaminyltransferase